MQHIVLYQTFHLQFADFLNMRISLAQNIEKKLLEFLITNEWLLLRLFYKSFSMLYDIPMLIRQKHK